MNILTVNLLFSTLVFWLAARIYLVPRLQKLEPRKVLAQVECSLSRKWKARVDVGSSRLTGTVGNASAMAAGAPNDRSCRDSAQRPRFTAAAGRLTSRRCSST